MLPIDFELAINFVESPSQNMVLPESAFRTTTGEGLNEMVTASESGETHPLTSIDLTK